jgi:hypothetical protein
MSLTHSPIRNNSSNNGSALHLLPGTTSPSIITHLTQEVADLRRRHSTQRALEDQIAHLQSLLTQQAQATHFADEEGRARVDASLTFIATLRNELDAQKRLLADKRAQNADLRAEL